MNLIILPLQSQYIFFPFIIYDYQQESI